MTARYTLTVVAEFASAHSLRDYPGDCRRLHGHNWRVEVEVTARELDGLGMAIDFKEVKRAAREAAGELDHRYLNDIPPFDTINPTAENLAAWFYRQVSDRLEDDRVTVSAVTLWETERARVRYSEDD